MVHGVERSRLVKENENERDEALATLEGLHQREEARLGGVCSLD